MFGLTLSFEKSKWKRGFVETLI